MARAKATPQLVADLQGEVGRLTVQLQYIQSQYDAKAAALTNVTQIAQEQLDHRLALVLALLDARKSKTISLPPTWVEDILGKYQGVTTEDNDGTTEFRLVTHDEEVTDARGGDLPPEDDEA